MLSERRLEPLPIPKAGLFDQLLYLCKVSEGRTVQQWLFRVSFVVGQRVGDGHPQGNGVHSVIVAQMDQSGGLAGIMDAYIGAE